MHRVAFLVVFAALLGEALLLSPAPRPDQTAWVMRLLRGDWAGEEPSVVVLFQLMGVWPLALVALLAPRLRRSPVPLWPFAFGSMALGAFVLLPGLALGGTVQPARRWQGWFGGRGLAALLGVVTLALLAWAAVSGSPARFAGIWRAEQFVHVMSFDFLALWIGSVVVAHEQRAELGGRWTWSVVPLLGVLALRLAVPFRPTAPDMSG